MTIDPSRGPLTPFQEAMLEWYEQMDECGKKWIEDELKKAEKLRQELNQESE